MTEQKPIAELAQSYALWKSQELALLDDELKVCYRSGPNVSRRTVPLEVIDTNETEGRMFPDPARWVAVGAFLLGLLAAGAAVALRLDGHDAPRWLFLAAGALLGVAALAAVTFVSLSYDATYFYHSYTGEFLCAIVKGKPDAAAAGDFLAKLKAQAKAQHERTKSDADPPSIARELKALDELRRKKVISDDEFDVKKLELMEDLMKEF